MENFLHFPWGRVWYRRLGTPGRPPLLVLHGGPAYPSDYLWNLEQLGSEREVIFYDQSGCGRSERGLPQTRWTTEHFARELAAVRQELGLGEMHLLGHSWGTMLAADYITSAQAGVRSVVFSSPCLSSRLWMEACEKHLAELPNGYGDVIKLYEAMGRTGDPVYQAAQRLYHTTYECRIVPAPASVVAANRGFNPDIYRFMWGNNEYTVSGTLKGYDRTEDLSRIHVPALFTCGFYDSASPEACALYQSKIPGAQLEIFRDSSHMPHLEEEANYLRAVGSFLRQHD